MKKTTFLLSLTATLMFASNPNYSEGTLNSTNTPQTKAGNLFTFTGFNIPEGTVRADQVIAQIKTNNCSIEGIRNLLNKGDISYVFVYHQANTPEYFIAELTSCENDAKNAYSFTKIDYPGKILYAKTPATGNKFAVAEIKIPKKPEDEVLKSIDKRTTEAMCQSGYTPSTFFYLDGESNHIISAEIETCGSKE